MEIINRRNPSVWQTARVERNLMRRSRGFKINLLNIKINKMDDKEKKAQEMYMEFQMLDQHIKQLQQQLEMVTHQLMELNSTSSSLDEFKKINQGKDLFVPLSSGIFARANIKDTSELLVNVGANVAVKKDVASTKLLIQNQLEEIRKIQKQMIDELEKLTSRAAQLEMQLQSMVSQGQIS